MKKLTYILLLFLVVIPLSGCNILKRDNMEDINIITTAYPLEYLTNLLYGEHSLVNSIYPDGINISEYKLTNKQVDDFSKKRLFIYAGVTNDKDIALKLLNNNNDLLIIDSSFGMKPQYSEELWLNPANMLMAAQNIKNGLMQYITNGYLKKDIDKKYEDIRIKLSELDAEIQLTCENANNKTIVVANDSLKYLTKYGLTVISLDGEVLDKTRNDVTALINSGQIKYIYTLENTLENETVKTLLSTTNVKELVIRKMDNITEKERDDKADYISIMKENVELLKKEMYK